MIYELRRPNIFGHSRKYYISPIHTLAPGQQNDSKHTSEDVSRQAQANKDSIIIFTLIHMLIGKLPSAIGTGLTYWDGRTSRLRKGGKGKKKKHQTPIPSVIIYTTFSRSIIYIHTHIPPSLHRARYQRIYPKKKSKSSNRRRERARSLCLIPRDIPRSLALLRSYYCLLDTYTNSCLSHLSD